MIGPALDEFVQALPKFFPLVEGLTVTSATDDPVLAMARMTDTKLRLGASGEGDGAKLKLSEEQWQQITDILNSEKMVYIDLKDVPAREYRFSHGVWYESPWVSTDVMATLLGSYSAREWGLEPLLAGEATAWVFPPDYVERLTQSILKRDPENRKVPVEDRKILSRLSHWQRRLGMSGSFVLVCIPGERPRFLSSETRIAIPGAALHWPGTLQDILLITALSHVKRRHRRWHLFAQLTTCIYWPLPWIQSLHANLLHNFQQSADRLAESCYRDSIGYSRALRQLEVRLTPVAGSIGRNDASNPLSSSSYLIRLHDLLSPALEPAWQLSDLVSIRSSEVKQLWTDPYDKVVLFVGQAVFLSFLLTGITLRERPPEIDYEYSMPFELFWKEHFHRSLELIEKTRPPGK